MKCDQLDNDPDVLVYQLRGFSDHSGLQIGKARQIQGSNNGEEEGSGETLEDIEDVKPEEPVIFQSDITGENSVFTFCLRFKIHFQRPEYVIASAYAGNETSFIFGNYETA